MLSFMLRWFIIDLVYFLVIILGGLYISYITRKLYSLSSHPGLNYFSKAFFFLSFGFVFRYLKLFSYDILTQIAIIYFISMFGFYLAFSLIWKDFEKKKKKELILHIVAITISVVNLYYYYFFFIIIGSVLAYVIIITYSNYKIRKNLLMQMFFISLFFAAISFMLNFLSIILLPIVRIFWVYSYLVDVIAVLVLVIGVYFVWQKKGKD